MFIARDEEREKLHILGSSWEAAIIFEMKIWRFVKAVLKTKNCLFEKKLIISKNLSPAILSLWQML